MTNRKADFDRALQQAAKVIEDCGISQPPIPIYDIILGYGLSLSLFDTSSPSILIDPKFSSVSGAIIPDKKLVLINSTDSPLRQVFTAAHELGHWILHPKEMAAQPELGIVIYRRPIGDEIDPLEQEANHFAANLLVPEHMLRKYHEHDADPHHLVKVFGVSLPVIGYRIKNLRL